jgi:predicted lipoprotein with Yx(FWY)xxD motif
VKYRNTTGVLAGLLLLLAACQPSASPTDSAAPSEAASEAASVAPSEGEAALALRIADTTEGPALAGADGLTLYIQSEEADGTIHCVDACAANWPPLIGPVDAGEADAALLGTITRPEGTEQVTYNGFPLYYFIGDEGEGDAAGEGLNGVWFIANPEGN